MSDLRLLAGVVLAPLIVVMLFNVFMLAVAFRVIVKQNRKKFFQGGDRHLMKMNVRNIVSLVWLIVLFGVGWLFGLMTIREVSKAFQYLFVILNAFQGFYFFIFIVLNQKEARTFWAGLITRGRFKSSRFVTSHNKAYVNSSDYKVRGNLGYLTALPNNPNQKNNQLINFLTLPDPATTQYASDSFVSTNEGILELDTVPLENVHTVRQETATADYDSRIEVTTYFDESEQDSTSIIPSNSLSSEERLINIPDSPPVSYTNIEAPGDVKCGVLYTAYMTEEDKDETPIPPKRRKRKNKSDSSAEKKSHHSEADIQGKFSKEPRQRKNLTFTATSITRKTEPTAANSGIQEEDETSAAESGVAQRRSATVLRQGKVSSFGEHRISRQRKVVEPLQAPFEITNPLYCKEE